MISFVLFCFHHLNAPYEFDTILKRWRLYFKNKEEKYYKMTKVFFCLSSLQVSSPSGTCQVSESVR